MTYSLPFAWGARTYVMGIVNVTPDSFSGDGLEGQGQGQGQNQDGGAEVVAAAVARA